jgi:hypothetical protein
VLVISSTGVKRYWSLDDPYALQLANKQKTDGVFQFDTDLAKSILRNGVRCFEDLMLFNAMGHPGPMASIPEAVKNRDDARGTWKKRLHPLILEVLEETYGVIVYQESLQAIWQRVASFTAPEAQEARKAVAKKWQDKLRPIKAKWIEGASRVLGRQEAEEWWPKMETFGRYAFNRCLDKDTLLRDLASGMTRTVDEWYRDGSPQVLLSVDDAGVAISDECLAIHDTGVQEVFEVEFDDGTIERVTANHKFLCDDGQYHTVTEIYELRLDVTSIRAAGPGGTAESA